MDNKQVNNVNYARITDKPHTVILALGCNTNYDAGMDKAISHIKESFCIQNETRRIISPSTNDTPGSFCNSLILIQTTYSVDEITKRIKQIETMCGRTKEETAKGIIRMDIDLLSYDEIRLRPNDWERPYIQELYEELKP